MKSNGGKWTIVAPAVRFILLRAKQLVESYSLNLTTAVSPAHRWCVLGAKKEVQNTALQIHAKLVWQYTIILLKTVSYKYQDSPNCVALTVEFLDGNGSFNVLVE